MRQEIVVMLAAAAISATVVVVTGSRDDSAGAKSTVSREAEPEGVESANASAESADLATPSADNAARAPAAVPANVPPEVAHIVQARPALAQISPKLLLTLERTPQGKMLLDVYDATLAASADPSAQARYDQLVEGLKKNPEKSFSDLNDSLGLLSRDEFPVERAEILDLMEVLPGKREDVRALALREALEAETKERPTPETARNELEMNEAMSSGPDMLLPLMAHQSFLRNARDFDDALSGTLEIVQRQRHPTVRADLVTQLAQQFPRERSRIVQTFSPLGFSLSTLANGEQQ